MRWLDSITDAMDMNLSKLWETVEDRGAWRAAVHGFTRSQTRRSDFTLTFHFRSSKYLLNPSISINLATLVDKVTICFWTTMMNINTNCLPIPVLTLFQLIPQTVKKEIFENKKI